MARHTVRCLRAVRLLRTVHRISLRATYRVPNSRFVQPPSLRIVRSTSIFTHHFWVITDQSFPGVLTFASTYKPSLIGEAGALWTPFSSPKYLIQTIVRLLVVVVPPRYVSQVNSPLA